MTQITGKNILITGGAGFIGSALAKDLSTGNHVTLFDNFSRSQPPSKQTFDSHQINSIHGDVLNKEQVKEAIKGFDIVIHAAAIAGIDNTVKNPVKTMNVNILGTANVIEAACHENLVRFINFSTSEVFGSQAYMASESSSTITGAVGEARWTYAVGKLAGEHLVHAYHKERGVPTTTVRPFNIYGPGQIGEGAISIMVRKALKDEPIYIFGNGSQIRAWCYIDDMVKAINTILATPKSIGETYNIGNERAVTTIHGLSQTICRVLNSKSEIVYKDALSADIELRIPSVSKAQSELGFTAATDLEEGIINTAKWIEQNYDRFPSLPEIFK